jgi:pimeloyl-ACP methyl ester carboxylesterase
MDSFSASIRDLRGTDLRPRLSELRIPAMGIYGRRDNVVSPKQAELIRKGVKSPVVHYFGRSGHFPMLDETDKFHTTILEFLTTS